MRAASRRSGARRRRRGRLPARAAHQRRRAGSATPAPRSSSCSPTTATRRAGSPPRLEELNRERQEVEERILREAVAKVERVGRERPAPPRATSLAGEDWHEGVIGIVASRLVERFNRPVVMIAGRRRGDWKGSGRSVSAFDLHGGLAASRGAPRALRRPPRRGRALDPAGERRRVRARVRRARRGASRRGGPPAGDVRRRGPAAGTRADARALRGAREARAVRARQPRGHAARRRAASCATSSAVGEGKHLRFRVRARRDAAVRSRSASGGQLDRFRTERPLRRRVPARGEPLERHRCAAARRAPDLRRERLLREPARLARRGVPEGRRATRSRRRSSPSSGSTATGDPRSLLESARFRALLEEPPLERAA